MGQVRATLRLIVDNRIRFRKSDLPPGALDAIKKAFRYNNPDYFRKRNLGYYVGNVPRVIGTFRVDKEGGWVTLPRGGLKKLIGILEGYGFQCEVDDRCRQLSPVEFYLDPSVKLRPYQVEAAHEILKHKTCLIQGAPASGKTEILLAAIALVGGRAGVMVHDRNLFDQWVKRTESRLGIPAKEIGRVGGGKFKLGPRITVMMQQTARNRIDQLADYFDFLAADEVHHYAARTFLETVDAFTARYRVGASATIKRQDLKHFLTHDLFGEVVFEINRQQLVDLGYTTEIELHVVHTDFNYDYRNEAALRDFLADKFQDWEDLSPKERLEIADSLGMNRKDYPQYLDAIAKDSDRNNLIYRWVRREYDQGGTSIIFTKRRSQCQLWAERLAAVGLECVVFWGGNQTVKEQKRIQRDLQRLKAKQVRIAIGTVIDEGLNMPAVDAGFITYRNASNPGQLEQQAGRLARLFSGKDVGRLYYFHDSNVDFFNRDEHLLGKRFKRIVIHAKTRRRKKLRS